jgi:hypothetical protein
MRYGWRAIYAAVCGALALVCLWFTVDELQNWWHPSLTYTEVLAGAAVLFTVTALAVARKWRAGSWLAGFTGAVLVLYGIAVVVMGWEDVGGARSAIPLALGTGAVGFLGLAIGVSEGLRRGEAA